jgi:hypothetical protein
MFLHQAVAFSPRGFNALWVTLHIFLNLKAFSTVYAFTVPSSYKTNSTNGTNTRSFIGATSSAQSSV